MESAAQQGDSAAQQGDGSAAQQDDGAERIAPYLPDAGSVTVFSAPWCGYCTGLKRMLRASDIAFREVLIEEDPEAERIAAAANGGDWIIPTVLYADGSTAVNPGLRKVQDHLAQLSNASKNN